jgi:H+/Na+-translocating ferredoxin:NAD+ oxidoreductase subunit B
VKRRSVALIDESRCIGCTLCIPACPVDAIIGARRLMHTVVEPWCIGCRLCLAPCPVDCIEMVAAPERPWTKADAEAAKRRARLRRERRSKAPAPRSRGERRGIIAGALARAQIKRGGA